MILEDVRLRYSEKNAEDAPFLYTSRVTRITTDRGTLETPARVTTRTELIARSKVPIFKTIPSELAIDFRQLGDSQVLDIMNNSKSATELLRLTKQFNDITRKSKFRISVFQPSLAILNSMSITERIRFADFQADYFQKRLGTNLISYPFLNLPTDEYKDFIDHRYGHANDISVIFTLDLNKEREYLKDILDHLINKGHPIIINLIHKPWQRTIPQHDLINSYSNREKVAFFASQVERIEHESQTSNLHSEAFVGGIDLVSLLQVRGHSDNKKLDLNKVRFFDPTTLGINNLDSTLALPNRSVIDEFGFSLGDLDFDYVSKIISGYRGGLVHPDKFKVLYYLARCHEAILSPRVFDNKRLLIEKNEIPDYIRETNLKAMPRIQVAS